MKKIVCLWVIMLLSFSFAIGQRKGKPPVRKPAPVAKFAEAEKAWIPFWKEFIQLIRIRNRQSLREVTILIQDNGIFRE